MKKVPLYAIPGLGVDGRIFQKLNLEREWQIIEWLEPAKKESLQSYAARMAESIDDPSCYLLGLSFGGVVAQELARKKNCKGLILLSSPRTREEIPFQFRLMRWLPLYQLGRGSWRLKALPIWAPNFGIHDPLEQAFLRDMFAGF